VDAKFHDGAKTVNANVDVQIMHKLQIYGMQMSASEAAAHCTVVHTHSLSVDFHSEKLISLGLVIDQRYSCN